jgi:hypothetical protein
MKAEIYTLRVLPSASALDFSHDNKIIISEIYIPELEICISYFGNTLNCFKCDKEL